MNPFPAVLARDLDPAMPADQRWLIDGLWGSDSVGIIGGEPKCCKSFLALGMAVSVASGCPCLDQYRVPKRGNVLLFAAEDALHIVRERLDGLCAHHGLSLADLDLWVITSPTIRLDRAEDRERLRQTVAAVRPALLVLDPFVRLHAIDENVSAAVAPLLGLLRVIQREYGCAVAVVHHARKGAGQARAGQALRGSSEFHAWGDSNLYVRRCGEQLRLTIEHRAQPSQTGIPLHLQIASPALALVVDKQADSQSPLNQQSLPKPPKERIQEALCRTHKPMPLRKLRSECAMRTQTVCLSLNDLVAEGKVIKTPQGWILKSALPLLQEPRAT